MPAIAFVEHNIILEREDFSTKNLSVNPYPFHTHSRCEKLLV